MKYILLSALLLFAPALAAQEDEKSDKKSIKVQLLAVVAPPEIGKVYLIADEDRSPVFNLPVSNVSEPLKVSARTLILKTADKDAPLCNILLPEAGMRFVVVLSPAKTAGYGAHVIRTDDISFQRGDCFFVNLTQKSILGKLGTKKFILESGKTAVYRPEGARPENFYDIAFATRGNDGDRILRTSRWPVDEQIRNYLFFIQNSNGQITYRAVDEFVMDER